MKENQLEPKYRYRLRARISESGYKTQRAYSKAVGSDDRTISRIVSGWELPSLNLSKKMAKKLGLTIKEFGELL